MFRPLLILFISCASLASVPAAISDNSGPSEGVPGRNTPKALTEAWLRFHTAELCQGMDAEFAFSKEGVRIQYLVDDNRAYQKMEEIFEPLRRSYRIELQQTQPSGESEPADDKEEKDRKDDPPPSLWENYELRCFLGDGQSCALQNMDPQEQSRVNPLPPTDDTIKQRLFIYGEQTLDSSKKIERYAKDIAALTRVAVNPDFEPGLRLQAGAICTTHARNMERVIEKLTKNLEPAFPRSSRKERSAQPEKPGNAPSTLVDQAETLREYAETVTKRIYQFIHPEHFTVGLDELRQPGLLESLRRLDKMDSDFQKALAKNK